MVRAFVDRAGAEGARVITPPTEARVTAARIGIGPSDAKLRTRGITCFNYHDLIE